MRKRQGEKNRQDEKRENQQRGKRENRESSIETEWKTQEIDTFLEDLP